MSLRYVCLSVLSERLGRQVEVHAAGERVRDDEEGGGEAR